MRLGRRPPGYGVLVPPASPARISLPERYRVVRHIANGGMAGVWEAHDQLLNRSVAVKVLASHLAEDDRARLRFEREARAAAGLSTHPHVVTIYDQQNVGGRFEPDGSFHGTRWQTRTEQIGDNDEHAHTTSLPSQPSASDVAALRALVEDVIDRAPARGEGERR